MKETIENDQEIDTNLEVDQGASVIIENEEVIKHQEVDNLVHEKTMGTRVKNAQIIEEDKWYENRSHIAQL
jgi:hypothetical protein